MERNLIKATSIDRRKDYPQIIPENRSEENQKLEITLKNFEMDDCTCVCRREEFDTTDIRSNYQKRTSKVPKGSGECHIHNKAIKYEKRKYPGSNSKKTPILPSQKSRKHLTTSQSLPESDEISKSDNIEQKIKVLTPKICEVSSQTYVVFLFHNLRAYSPHITLAEFYNLLCHFNAMDSGICTKTKETEVEKSFETDLEREGVQICSFILETFRKSCKGINSSLVGSLNLPMLSFVKFDDILRNFLAIKILIDSIKFTEDNKLQPNIVPRKSLYESYCRVCQELVKRFQKDKKVFKLHMNTVMGISHFGKLLKMIYPNLKSRRLGRRGHSRHHCLGIIWKDPFSTLDSKRVEVNQTNLDIMEGITSKDFWEQVLPETESPNLIKQNNIKGKQGNKLSPGEGKLASFYSFISSSSRFPEIEFSPRIWTRVPGKLPKPSVWTENTISRSASALKRYNVDVRGIIQNLHFEMFRSVGSTFFVSYFVPQLHILINGNSDEKGYMHLYLIILQLIFPLILSADKEVSFEEKTILRKNLLIFTNHLTASVPNLPDREWGHFLNFSNLIRRMIHFNQLTSCRIESRLIKGITKTIASDVKILFGFEYDFCEAPPSENIILRAVIMASKAFESTFVDHNNDFILKIVKSFAKFTIAGTKGLLNIPNSLSNKDLKSTTFDLPFQVFLVSIQCFNEICLSDPLMLQLPIQVINCISVFIHNELHNVNFDEFGTRDQELSKNTFKTWWVYSTLAQEYMQILSEIVGLSQ